MVVENDLNSWFSLFILEGLGDKLHALCVIRYISYILPSALFALNI